MQLSGEMLAQKIGYDHFRQRHTPECRHRSLARLGLGIQGPFTTCGFVWFSSDQSLSRGRLFATPWIAAHQASLSIINSRSSLRLTSIESVMPSSHLILCHPLLLLPPIPPSIRVFSNESTLHMRWPEYWTFSFSIIRGWDSTTGCSVRFDHGTIGSCLDFYQLNKKNKRNLGSRVPWHAFPFMKPPWMQCEGDLFRRTVDYFLWSRHDPEKIQVNVMNPIHQHLVYRGTNVPMINLVNLPRLM